MKKISQKWKKVAATVLGVALVLPLVPFKVQAQFLPGIPTIVFDPSSYGQMVEVAQSDLSLLAKAIDEVAILGQLYTNALQLYNLSMFMTQELRAKNFTGAFSIATLAFPTNMSGQTGAWGPAVNGGINPAGGWGGATIPLQPNPYLLAGDPMISHFASAEIYNGAGIAAIQALGQVRAAQTLFQTSAQTCEDNSMSFDPLDNTQIAQLNMGNGCQSLMLRQSQSSMALQSAQLDLTLAQAKMTNDLFVDQLNSINVMQTALATNGGGEFQDDMNAVVAHVDR